MSLTSATRVALLGHKVARVRQSIWACRGLRARATSAPVDTVQVRRSSGLTYSVSQGPSEPPLLPHTIPEHFAEIVSEHGDRQAVICRSPTVTGTAEEVKLSYAALDSGSNALAHSLRSLGVRKGDRVAVKLGNTAEHATLTYAIFKLGAILVPLNPNFNTAQVGAALSHLGVEVLIIGAVADKAYKPCQGRSNLELLQGLVPDLGSGRIESPGVPTLRRVVVVDNTGYHHSVDFRLDDYPSLTPYTELNPSHRLSDTRSVTPDSPLSPEETINIQFTSGTTSHPKAAMLTHTSILNNGHLIAGRMGLHPSDLIVCPPPLFHCFGSVLGYMATATTGAAILFPSPAFDPRASLHMAADHRATGLHGVATMFVSMLELLDDDDDGGGGDSGKEAALARERAARLPSHLSKGIAAGSSVPEALVRKLYGKLGLGGLVICYGMTETSPVSCMTSPADPLGRRTGSVGRVMPHTRVKIVDPGDRSRVLPVGERGELAASGYLVMQGYWDDEGRTREVRVLEPDVVDVGRRDDGGHGHHHRGGVGVDTGIGAGASASASGNNTGSWWMYSGDEASMSEDGYVSITGRIKDLIIRGGENIHPLEIENVLFQHPLVAEASVVGVPDERYGEAVCAFVVAAAAARSGVATEDDDPSSSRGDNSRLARPRGGSQQEMPVLRGDDVRRWVRSRLSGHLVPRYVFWADEFPKTASGKIQKYKLREAARDLLRSHTGPKSVGEKYEAVREEGG